MKKEKPAAKSVHDVISGLGSKAGKKLHRPESVNALAFIWMECVSEKLGEFVPPLTAKQRGQLKLFRSKCPDGIAEKVLRHTIERWTEFIKRVEMDAGVKALPAKPNIDFLLKYAGTAVNLFLLAQKEPEVTQEATVGQTAANAVQLTAKQPEKSEEEKPGSTEELVAIIGWDYFK